MLSISLFFCTNKKNLFNLYIINGKDFRMDAAYYAGFCNSQRLCRENSKSKLPIYRDLSDCDRPYIIYEMFFTFG